MNRFGEHFLSGSTFAAQQDGRSPWGHDFGRFNDFLHCLALVDNAFESNEVAFLVDLRSDFFYLPVVFDCGYDSDYSSFGTGDRFAADKKMDVVGFRSYALLFIVNWAA